MDALRRPEVLQVWGNIASAVSAEQAVELFRTGLDLAVTAVHGELGRVVSAPGKGRRFGGPTNEWFDGACKQARAEWKRAVRLHGHESEGALEAQRANRAHVRVAKHAHDSRSQLELVSCLYDDPRQFWKRFQSGGAQSSGFSAQEWTDWFEQLLSANTAGSYEGGSLDMHCQAYPDLFPDPSPEALQAAARLNDHFTVGELSAAMSKLANHKAAGVDGMPAEFLTQAATYVPTGVGAKTSRGSCWHRYSLLFAMQLWMMHIHVRGRPVPLCLCLSPKAGRTRRMTIEGSRLAQWWASYIHWLGLIGLTSGLSLRA